MSADRSRGIGRLACWLGYHAWGAVVGDPNREFLGWYCRRCKTVRPR